MLSADKTFQWTAIKMGEAFRLSAKAAKTTKLGDYCDGNGLWLVVKSASAAKWVFRFTFRGKPTEMGLGGRDSVSIGLARDRAQAAREQVAIGINPIEARRIAKARNGCTTFGEVASEFIEAKRAGWRMAVEHSRTPMGSLQTQCASIWPKPIDGIGVVDILGVLKPLWIKTPQTASRVRNRIESILGAAKAHGLRSGENPAAWRGHLEHLLPKRQKLAQPHFAAMPYPEIPAFVESLRKRPDVPHLAVEFLILTACRSSEVRGAQWDEIDLDRATWTLPPSRMKAGLVHVVPLAPRAVEILREVAGQQRGGLVFPGRGTGLPVVSSSLAKLLPAGSTLHGFRSAFRDFPAEQTSFPREIAEEALAHATGNATERAYLRTNFLERRRELMALWAQFCEPAASAKVTSITKAVR
jgi:integrase